MSEKTDIGDATAGLLYDLLSTETRTKVENDHLRRANIVDGLFAIADSLSAIAAAIGDGLSEVSDSIDAVNFSREEENQ